MDKCQNKGIYTMNRLTSKAPDYVVINNAQYPINTNFRDCIHTIIALSNKKLSNSEKFEIILWNAYDDYVIVPGLELEFAEAALNFLSLNNMKEKTVHEKLIDFEIDAENIYAAFLKSGYDLDQIDDMHWWKWMAIFSEVSECTETRLIYLRSQKNKGKLSKEEREECARIGWHIINMVDYEDTTEDDQELIEFEKLLNG